MTRSSYIQNMPGVERLAYFVNEIGIHGILENDKQREQYRMLWHTLTPQQMQWDVSLPEGKTLFQHVVNDVRASERDILPFTRTLDRSPFPNFLTLEEDREPRPETLDDTLRRLYKFSGNYLRVGARFLEMKLQAFEILKADLPNYRVQQIENRFNASFNEDYKNNLIYPIPLNISDDGKPRFSREVEFFDDQIHKIAYDPKRDLITATLIETPLLRTQLKMRHLLPNVY